MTGKTGYRCVSCARQGTGIGERDAVSEGWWTATIAEWSPSPPVRLPRTLLRRVALPVLGVVVHRVVRGVLARAVRDLLSRPATAQLPAHRRREIERDTNGRGGMTRPRPNNSQVTCV